MLSTCYVSDNPWLASSHTTSRDQGQVRANSIRNYSSSSPRRHNTGLSELRGKKQQQPTIYNLAWRDAHARTTQESHLTCAMRDPRTVWRAPSQPTGSYNIRSTLGLDPTQICSTGDVSYNIDKSHLKENVFFLPLAKQKPKHN